MPVATEIVQLRLRPGADPRELGSKTSDRWKSMLTMGKEKEGFIRAYWVSQPDKSVLRMTDLSGSQGGRSQCSFELRWYTSSQTVSSCQSQRSKLT
jgi:hypothetical protein